MANSKNAHRTGPRKHATWDEAEAAARASVPENERIVPVYKPPIYLDLRPYLPSEPQRPKFLRARLTDEDAHDLDRCMVQIRERCNDDFTARKLANVDEWLRVQFGPGVDIYGVGLKEIANALEGKPLSNVSNETMPLGSTLEHKRKTKRSTHKGDAREKLIASLLLHHEYDNGRLGNNVAIGNNALARLADVRESTASVFFRKHFGGYKTYKTACSRNIEKVRFVLKALNGDFAIDDTYGTNPPE